VSDQVGRPPGRLARLAVVVIGSDPVERRRIAAMCSAAGIDALYALEASAVADLMAGAPKLPVSVLVLGPDPMVRTLPVSIGRTTAEATARLAFDPDFAGFGDPRQVGLFGTLEMCQAEVIRLVHEGVVEFRCVLPPAPDVHDVIAQLTAVMVGDPSTHRPDAARSPDPDPPAWATRRPR
jgi:hypothetical protein